MESRLFSFTREIQTQLRWNIGITSLLHDKRTISCSTPSSGPTVPAQSVKVTGNWGRPVSKTVFRDMSGTAFHCFHANDKYGMTTHSARRAVFFRKLRTNAPLSVVYASRSMLIYSVFAFFFDTGANVKYFPCYISVRQY